MATLSQQRSAEDWQAEGDRRIAAGDTAGGDAAHCAAVAAAVRDPELLEAGSALAEGRLGVAERLLRPRLKRRPTDVAAMRMLAELAGRLGRYADAETLLRRALDLAPSFREARFNLATILHRRARSTDALAEIDRLLGVDPGNPSYRNLRAAALARLGEFDASLAAYAQPPRRPSAPAEGVDELWPRAQDRRADRRGGDGVPRGDRPGADARRGVVEFGQFEDGAVRRRRCCGDGGGTRFDDRR